MLKRVLLQFLVPAAFLLLWAMPLQAQWPKRMLTIELRQMNIGATGGYTVGTEAGNPALQQQEVQVLNGEKASVTLVHALPMQWVQSVQSHGAPPSASGGSGTGSGGVVNAIRWTRAGQRIDVHPRWPGGAQAVTVDVQVQVASVVAGVDAALPAQSRSELVTTVSIPLGRWVTIAATGISQSDGGYGSEPATATRSVLQLRVLAP